MMTKKIQLKDNMIFACLLLAYICIFTIASMFWGRELDDSWITERFARNLFHGFGLRWNSTDSAPTEAYTSLLHVLLIAPAYVAGDYGILWSKLLGLICCGGVFLALAIYARRLAISVATLAFIFTLLCSNCLLAFHSITAMETMLGTLILVISTILVMETLDSLEALPICLISCFFGILTRPEFVIVYSLYALIVVSIHHKEWRRILKAGVILFVFLGAYALFKYIYFGGLFPTSYYFKANSGGFPGWEYVVAFLKEQALAPFVFILLGAIWCRMYRVLCMACAVLLAIFYYVTVRPSVGVGFRFLIPYYPVIIYFVMIILDRVLKDSWLLAKDFWRRTVIVAVSGVLLFSLHPAKQIEQIVKLREYLRPRAVNVAIGKALSGFANSQSIVLATGDAGAIPYFSDMRHVDPHGLVTPGFLDDAKADRFYECNPDIFVTHSIIVSNSENRVAYDEKDAQQQMANPDRLTSKWSYQIITDERFRDYAIIARIPYAITPLPNQYYSVFAKRNSRVYGELQRKFKDLYADLQFSRGIAETMFSIYKGLP